jgi:N-acetyl-anhydromuramyl-L-alanine amidase AmpD
MEDLSRQADPRTYHFKLPRYQGARHGPPPCAWYPGTREHWPHCTSERTLHSDGRIRAVVIHATVLPTSAEAIGEMLRHRCSFHWLIPGKHEPEHGRFIWACVPEELAAWHVRKECFHPEVNFSNSYVNYWSLGIEIVNKQQEDSFSDWQVEQTAALVRYAWSKYPELVDVVSHAKLDPERRTDPGKDFPWERFRELVLGGV